MTFLCAPHPSLKDPFFYFGLNKIWPEPYLTPAWEATKEDAQSGQIFMIHKSNSDVVGLTGIFFELGNDDDVFLRWTGIVPGERHRGHAADAMRQLIQMCQGWLPERKRLVELVPDNEYGAKHALPFFIAAGFVQSKIGKHEETDWPVKVYAFKLKA